MAQWIGQPKRPSDAITEQGMAAMGRPIPSWRQQAAYEHLKQMGVTSALDRTACVGAMVDRLQRDEPYDAMGEGMRYVDLTGTYRLMAVLLAEPKPPGYDERATDRFPGLGTA